MGCWEAAGTTTTPDWVFSLMLGAGVVALAAGVAWLVFLFEPPAERPRPSRAGRIGRAVSGVLLAACAVLNVVAGIRSPEVWAGADGIVGAGTLVLLLVPLTAVTVGLRRFRRTGAWPLRRAAPFGTFWLLPPLAAVAALVSAGSLVAMLASIQVTSGGPC